MNGMLNPIVFYPIAFFVIVFAILTVYMKNIFHSLLSAICVFFLAGVIFYILGSEYNAIIQIAIYGVAVPIIIGIAVMFTNLKNDVNSDNKVSPFAYFLFLICGIFIIALIYLIMTSLLVNPLGFNINENIDNTSVKVINSFAQGIFTRYVWAFELLSLILTIVVAGLTLFNKKEEKCKK